MIDPNTPIACLTVGQFIELQRTEASRPKPPSVELPKYLSPVELAKLLGWKITTVYQNHCHRLIPGASKVGNRVLFETAKIIEWVEQGRVPTKAEKVKAIIDKYHSISG